MADSETTTPLPGAHEGRTTISRRHALSGMAAIATVGLAAGGTAMAIDPDAELKRRWQALQEHEGALVNDADGDVAEAWLDQWANLQRAVAALPAQTIAGLSIKVQMLAQEAVDGYSDRFAAIVTTALDSLERMAPGSVVYRPHPADLIMDDRP